MDRDQTRQDVISGKECPECGGSHVKSTWNAAEPKARQSFRCDDCGAQWDPDIYQFRDFVRE